ncbi:hypothetical protein DFJ58DRAFT_847297 [Suillus subalutaceus]|uniref:uncharacterized protein n=1 Tax=Suillus subalutaceus TaxID=48586 RepID=UPI001B86C922|nr:uncharacterized protein DFJ58DRAFT_847297 [Suillus subalutaceus]KAG1835883.1 hypothetical protein DFJ58DRAFT_847297 [Suillus subalutaceus]
MPSVSLTDAGCNIINYTINGINVVVTAMLGVIMIARLHAMYQRSRRMLIFLVVIFLAVNIACGVLAAMALKDVVGADHGPKGDISSTVTDGPGVLLFPMETGWPRWGICKVDGWADGHEFSIDGLAEVVGYYVDGCTKTGGPTYWYYFVDEWAKGAVKDLLYTVWHGALQRDEVETRAKCTEFRDPGLDKRICDVQHTSDHLVFH